jgi:hypothetical protein
MGCALEVLVKHVREDEGHVSRARFPIAPPGSFALHAEVAAPDALAH